ncbi:hypothetical protein, partial [Propioniciclava soli]|uniref:hypothetical protein n=1 Tax=Propioniciclava soli TaxID=2775081 RepID=UPI001E50DEFE
MSILTDLALDKAPVGGTYLYQVRARMVGDTSMYNLTVRLLPTGQLGLQVSRTVGGAETVLRSTTINGFNYVAGEKVNVRFDVTGSGTTTLNGTVWRGVTEPATPSITVTDSTAALQGPGAVGLRFYTGGGTTSLPLAASVDRF